MKKLFCLFAVCCFLAGCSSSDSSLLEAPVTLSETPLVLVPKHVLSAPFHFNVLCVAVPPEYQIDNDSLRDPNGGKVVIQATLTTTGGHRHLFRQAGSLASRYVCLQADPSMGPGSHYKEVSISSSALLRTSEMRWFSTDEL